MYKLVKLQDLEIAPDAPLFCDTETLGLYGKIRLFQAYQKHWTHVMIVEYPDPVELYSLLSKTYSVWHNAHYDLTTLQQNLGGIPAKVTDFAFADTFLLARIATPQHDKYGLDEVMARVLGYDPYAKIGVKKELQKSDWSSAKLTEQQLTYAATDVKYMPEVWEVVRYALDEPSYMLDILTLRHCMNVQWNGMPILQYEINKATEEAIEALNAIDMPINVNSYKQVRAWLGGVTESDDSALSKMELADGNTKARDIRKCRKLKKLLSFLAKYESHAPVLKGKLKVSARSGRLTSDNENIQQIPRALKKVFGYERDSGKVLIFADYAQIELRTIAATLNVTKMVELFREGEDLHAFTAEMLFGKNWEKKHRLYSKGANFGLLYGGGVDMFIGFLTQVASVILDKREASRIRSKWQSLWPEIYRWQQEGLRKWRNGRLGVTPYGRKYKAKMMTDFLNIQNQGAGAEVFKLAIHYLEKDYLPKLREQFNLSYSDLYTNNLIHDSFILTCVDEPEVYTAAAQALGEAMQEAWFEMSKVYAVKDLPMPVDIRVGYNWGELDSDDGFRLLKLDLPPYHMMEKVNGVH